MKAFHSGSTTVPQKRVASCRSMTSHDPNRRPTANVRQGAYSAFYGYLRHCEDALVMAEGEGRHFVRNEGAVGSNPITSTTRTALWL
jgi:hypothetical protein